MSTATNDLTVTISRQGRSSNRFECIARLGADVVYTDVICPSKSRERRRYLQEVVRRQQARGHSADVDACELLLLAQLDQFPTNERQPAAEPLDADAVLRAIGAEIIGEHADQSIEIFVPRTAKRSLIKSPAKWQPDEMLQSLGEEIERVVHFGGRHSPSMLSPADVRRALAIGASRAPRIRDGGIIGQGVWYTREQVVVVNGGNAWAYDGQRVTTIERPVFDGRILDVDAAGRWAAEDLATRVTSMTVAVSNDSLRRLHGLLCGWQWLHSYDATVQAGLVAATLVQPCWTWRPLNSIVGPSDSGKSTLFQELLGPILGDWAITTDRATEAGLRQAIGHSAAPVLIDEFDRYPHRQAILNLFRSASRGGKVLRGTRNQQAVAYSLHHIPWFAAIEMGDNWAQDRNRFIRAHLGPLANRGHLDLPSYQELRELGTQLLAAAIWAIPTARILANQLKRTRIEGVHGRAVESYSVPAAMASVLMYGRAVTDAQAGQLLNQFVVGRDDLTEQTVGEDQQLLSDILASIIRAPGHTHGDRTTYTVADVIGRRFRSGGQYSLAAPPASLLAEIETFGLAVVEHATQYGLFIAPKLVLTGPLQGTRWADCRIDTILRRLPGAAWCQQRCGGQRPWGVWLPYAGCLDVLLA